MSQRTTSSSSDDGTFFPILRGGPTVNSDDCDSKKNPSVTTEIAKTPTATGRFVLSGGRLLLAGSKRNRKQQLNPDEPVSSLSSSSPASSVSPNSPSQKEGTYYSPSVTTETPSKQEQKENEEEERQLAESIAKAMASIPSNKKSSQKMVDVPPPSSSSSSPTAPPLSSSSAKSFSPPSRSRTLAKNTDPHQSRSRSRSPSPNPSLSLSKPSITKNLLDEDATECTCTDPDCMDPEDYGADDDGMLDEQQQTRSAQQEEGTYCQCAPTPSSQYCQCPPLPTSMEYCSCPSSSASSASSVTTEYCECPPMEYCECPQMEFCECPSTHSNASASVQGRKEIDSACDACDSYYAVQKQERQQQNDTFQNQALMTELQRVMQHPSTLSRNDVALESKAYVNKERTESLVETRKLPSLNIWGDDNSDASTSSSSDYSSDSDSE